MVTAFRQLCGCIYNLFFLATYPSSFISSDLLAIICEEPLCNLWTKPVLSATSRLTFRRFGNCRHLHYKALEIIPESFPRLQKSISSWKCWLSTWIPCMTSRSKGAKSSAWLMLYRWWTFRLLSHSQLFILAIVGLSIEEGMFMKCCLICFGLCHHGRILRSCWWGRDDGRWYPKH